MAYPPEDRPASPPGAAESLTPGSPASPGAPEPLMPRPPGSSLDARRDEPGGASLEATDGPSRPVGDEAATDTRPEPVKLTPTRTSAMWLGVWAGVLVVILLIIFVAQNTAGVEINFLWMSGRISLALAMLIAGVAGAIIAMAVAAARIIQLRRMVRRAR